MSNKPPRDEPDDVLVDRLANVHDQILAGRLDETAAVTDQFSDAAASRELSEALKIMSMIDRVRRAHGKGVAETVITDSTLGPLRDDDDSLIALHKYDAQSPSGSSHRVKPAQQRIGHFEIVKELGSGGAGIVFLARDAELDRHVALKLPRPESLLTAEMRERFLREAKAAAMLSHPQIVTILQVGHAGSVCYIASEYVQGTTLADWIARHQLRDEPLIAARLVAALAGAVQHAHSRGVLHRDLKPSNILIDEQAANADSLCKTSIPSAVRITDFGLAKLSNDDSKLTRSGAMVGTPAYMSPEQTSGGAMEIGPATDVYALGAILYELLTGRPPASGDTILETIRAVQGDDAISTRRLNALVSRDLDAICLKCLEKSASDRYASAYELEQDLKRLIAGQPVVARPVTNWDRTSKWAKRNPALAASLAAVAVSLIAVTVLWLRAEGLRRESDQRQQQVMLKADQLTLAINRLFTAVAESPEIKLQGAEPLRKRLLDEANRFYSEFVDEEPENRDLQTEYWQTLLRLAQVKALLGDRSGATQLAQKLLDHLPSNTDLQNAHPIRIRVTMFLAKQHLRGGDRDGQKRLTLESVELARTVYGRLGGQGTDDPIELAKVLADAADIFIVTGDMTMGTTLVDEAVQCWGKVAVESLTQQQRFDRATTFSLAAKAYTASEVKKERAMQLAQAAVDDFEINLGELKPVPIELLVRLGETYRTLGIIHDKDFAASQDAFANSLAIYAQLASAHPLVPTYQRNILALRYSMALSCFLSDHQQEACKLLEDNIEAGHSLLTSFPTDQLPTLRPLANSETLLGIVQLNLNQPKDALATYQRSREMNQRILDLTGGRPDADVALAGVDGNIGECLTKLERYGEAVEKFEASNARLLNIVNRDPDNGQALRYLSGNYEQLAKAFGGLAKWDAALESYRLSMSYNQKSDKRNAFAVEATYLARVGQLDEALSRFDEYVHHQDNPATSVVSAAKLLTAVQSTTFDGLSSLRVAAAVDHIAEIGVAALKQLSESQDDPTTLESLESLLDTGALEPLKSTKPFQLWHESRNEVRAISTN